jgi:tetratricopeptide (TPR) repeat protein
LVAGLLSALAIVFVAGLTGFVWQWQLARERAAELEREHERAEENLKILREKVDRLSELGRDLAKEPRLQQTALALLEEALTFYQRMLPQETIDPRVRQEAARLYGAVANTYHSAGKWQQAADHYRRQAELLSALANHDAANHELKRLLAVSYRNRGNVLRDLGESGAARAAYKQAADIQQLYLDASPKDPARQVALANTLLNLATVLSPQTEADEIEKLYRRVVELDRAAVDTDRARDYYQAELALGLENLGLRLLARGQLDAARAAIDEALGIHKQLLLVPAQKGYVERYVARNYISQGRVLAASGKLEDAEQAYKEAVALLTPLVQQGRAYPYNRMELARALTRWADLVKQTTRKSQVEGLLRQAIDHYKVLKDDFPEDKNNPLLLTATYLKLVSWLWELGQPDAAAEPYRLAFAVAPEDAAVNNGLAWFLATTAEPRLWKPAEAVRLAQKAVDARPYSGAFWNTLGVAHYRNNDDKAAIAALHEAMRLRSGGDSFDWFFLAMAHFRQGNHDEARRWFDAAVAWMAKRAPQDGELGRFRAEAQAALAQAKQE